MKLFILSLMAFMSVGLMHAQETEADPYAVSDKKRFIIAGGINFGYRLGKSPDGISGIQKDYLNSLRSGVSFDAAAYYKFTERHAVGFKFNHFQSSAKLSNVDIVAPNGDTGFGTIEDNIKISYYGPSYMYDLIKGQNQFNFEASVGYITYTDDGKALGNYEYFGDTLGLLFTASYKYLITPSFSVGPRISFMAGTITHFEISGPNGYYDSFNLPEDSGESMVRLDAGVVAAFRF